MIEYPKAVYMDGEGEIDGVSAQVRVVADPAEYEAALSDGWRATLRGDAAPKRGKPAKVAQ